MRKVGAMSEDAAERSGQDSRNERDGRSGQVGPELARYLPLSQRPRRDESAVTGEWSVATGVVAGRLADAIAGASAEALATPSLRAGLSVLEVAALLAWRLSTTRTERATERVSRLLRARRADAAARTAQREASAGRDAVEARLRAAATASAHRPLGDLSAAVLATLDTAGALAVTPEFDAIAAGAVALARSLNAPLPIRAVLADHTLVATDGDWQVGTGPATRSTTVPILLFLFGRGGVPLALTG